MKATRPLKTQVQRTKKPAFATPYKYVKSKKDKIYAGSKAEINTEANQVKREGRA